MKSARHFQHDLQLLVLIIYFGRQYVDQSLFAEHPRAENLRANNLRLMVDRWVSREVSPMVAMQKTKTIVRCCSRRSSVKIVSLHWRDTVNDAFLERNILRFVDCNGVRSNDRYLIPMSANFVSDALTDSDLISAADPLANSRIPDDYDLDSIDLQDVSGGDGTSDNAMKRSAANRNPEGDAKDALTPKPPQSPRPKRSAPKSTTSNIYVSRKKLLKHDRAHERGVRVSGRRL